jgi:hypothetical protein
MGGMKQSVRLRTIGRLTGKWRFFDITTFELALRLQTYSNYIQSGSSLDLSDISKVFDVDDIFIFWMAI